MPCNGPPRVSGSYDWTNRSWLTPPAWVPAASGCSSERGARGDRGRVSEELGNERASRGGTVARTRADLHRANAPRDKKEWHRVRVRGVKPQRGAHPRYSQLCARPLTTRSRQLRGPQISNSKDSPTWMHDPDER